jgi:hypothetical protein
MHPPRVVRLVKVERAIRESGPGLEATLRYALDVSQKLVISREFREQVRDRHGLATWAAAVNQPLLHIHGLWGWLLS